MIGGIRDCSAASSKRVMLLTSEPKDSCSGGRQLLCRLNREALKEIYGDGLIVFELPIRRLRGVRSTFNAFRGYIDGLNAETIGGALRTITSEDVGKVFVDGSNLGAFTQRLKQRLPHIEVSTFFHNVEARFFLGSLGFEKSLRALAVLIVNYLAESKSVRHSDRIVCLNERDSRLLHKVYGRPATHVSAMALEDKMPGGYGQFARDRAEKFALFVGGSFYANRAGITWFVEQVVPRIGIKTCIVGRGFEGLRQELERHGRVEVMGAVDDLADWYCNALFVIAPIFDGSGMKTKVAEALMYGKKIIGTPEAFSGYEDIADRAGWVCRTADDFVAAIDRAQKELSLPFDQELRRLYEEQYSFPAAKARLASILGAGTSLAEKVRPSA